MEKSYKDQAIHLVKMRKLRPIIKRTRHIIYALILVFVIIAAVLMWRSGYVTQVTDKVSVAIVEGEVQAGLTLDNIYLEGMRYVRKRDILKIIIDMGYKENTPIFEISLPSLKNKLEENGWIKEADLERQLPNTLHIRIVERIPYAIWQHDGTLQVIDVEGDVISSTINGHFRKTLTILVGKDANKQIAWLYSFMKKEPELLKKVSSIISVGERRWDIQLKNGIYIKLPEENPEKAWRGLAKLQRTKHILDRKIKSIDLRVEGKLYIYKDE